jgi:hypothetical protein
LAPSGVSATGGVALAVVTRRCRVVPPAVAVLRGFAEPFAVEIFLAGAGSLAGVVTAPASRDAAFLVGVDAGAASGVLGAASSLWLESTFEGDPAPQGNVEVWVRSTTESSVPWSLAT